MTLSNKTPSTQMYRLMLYQRALHPELFAIQGRRTITQNDYELEAWISPGGHSLRFQTQGHCVTEVVSGQEIQLPERGLIHHLPCIGEKEYDVDVEDRIRFVTAIQTENLSDNLYMATYNEMRDFAEEAEAMTYGWTESDGGMPNLTVLDLQRYRKEIHAQSYHLLAQGGFILRTQTIFELI
jgi:hypothetical protein